jgi:hypothetical protein
VKYYSYFGFQRVRAVGDNGLRDLPDLLVWGGAGMRMVRRHAASLLPGCSAITRGSCSPCMPRLDGWTMVQQTETDGSMDGL